MEDTTLSKRDRKKLNREAHSEAETKSPITNKLLTVAAIVVLGAGAFWFMYKGDSPSGSTENTEAITPANVSEEDYAKGPGNAVVTLVEYGDFQCPACAAYHPIVSQLADELKDDLRVVYRHFPLNSIHRHAQIAAQAAEAAGEQEKFWEMHDILFERQDDWVNVRDPRSLFKEYATELELNVEQFDTFMNSSEAKARVDADYKSGVAAAIQSTPTFYVNGEKIEGPQGFEPFKALIQAKIDELKTANPETTSSGEASPAGSITPQL